MKNLIKLTVIVRNWDGSKWTNTGTKTVLLNPAKIINVEEREEWTVVRYSSTLVDSYNVKETLDEIYNLANDIEK